MRQGIVSAKAGARLHRGLKLARAMYRPDSTSADGKSLSRDDGGAHQFGEVPSNEINHPTNQGGSGRYGRRVSRGGGIGKAESQAHRGEIDAGRNKRPWPYGSEVSARNQGPSGVRGGVVGSNGNGDPRNWYSAGPGRRFG